MNIELDLASIKEKETIKNLMQFYFYDFTEFNDSDLHDDGWFGDYPHIDQYWLEEDSRFPYIIRVD